MSLVGNLARRISGFCACVAPFYPTLHTSAVRGMGPYSRGGREEVVISGQLTVVIMPECLMPVVCTAGKTSLVPGVSVQVVLLAAFVSAYRYHPPRCLTLPLPLTPSVSSAISPTVPSLYSLQILWVVPELPEPGKNGRHSTSIRMQIALPGMYCLVYEKDSPPRASIYGEYTRWGCTQYHAWP